MGPVNIPRPESFSDISDGAEKSHKCAKKEMKSFNKRSSKNKLKKDQWIYLTTIINK